MDAHTAQDAINAIDIAIDVMKAIRKNISNAMQAIHRDISDIHRDVFAIDNAIYAIDSFIITIVSDTNGAVKDPQTLMADKARDRQEYASKRYFKQEHVKHIEKYAEAKEADDFYMQQIISHLWTIRDQIQKSMIDAGKLNEFDEHVNALASPLPFPIKKHLMTILGDVRSIVSGQEGNSQGQSS